MSETTIPKKEINLNTLEADVLLNRFEYPVLLVTFKGIIQTDGIRYDTYDLHTPDGIVKKNKMILAFMAEDAPVLDKCISIDAAVKRLRLRTKYHREDRPVVITDEMLSEAVGKDVSVTMMNGQVLDGVILEYNQYNFTLNITDKVVLGYRHAVHQFQ